MEFYKQLKQLIIHMMDLDYQKSLTKVGLRN